MISFSKIFVDLILSGQKTQTRRLGKKRWREGSVHVATWNRFDPTARFARLWIIDVREQRIGDITEEEAHMEGFDSRESFLRMFYDLNKHKLPPLGWKDETVWVVTFEVVVI